MLRPWPTPASPLRSQLGVVERVHRRTASIASGNSRSARFDLAERLADPPAQRLGRLVPAAHRDDAADLHLEVEALRARRALVEMTRDRSALPDGELTVEELIHAGYRAFAIHSVVRFPRLCPGG